MITTKRKVKTFGNGLHVTVKKTDGYEEGDDVTVTKEDEE